MRRLAAVLTLVFALYLAPGLANAPQGSLRLLSGFPPPWSYSLYSRGALHQDAHGPVQPQVVNDLETALQLAKEQQKPLLLDFTGYACVNCRKMEEQVWTAPAIAQLLREEVILVSLYVDDRQPCRSQSALPTPARTAPLVKSAQWEINGPPSRPSTSGR